MTLLGGSENNAAFEFTGEGIVKRTCTHSARGDDEVQIVNRSTKKWRFRGLLVDPSGKEFAHHEQNPRNTQCVALRTGCHELLRSRTSQRNWLDAGTINERARIGSQKN